MWVLVGTRAVYRQVPVQFTARCPSSLPPGARPVYRQVPVPGLLGVMDWIFGYMGWGPKWFPQVCTIISHPFCQGLATPMVT